MRRSLRAALFACAMVAVALWIGQESINTHRLHADESSTATYEGGTLVPGAGLNGTTAEFSPALLSRRPTGPYIVIDTYCNKLFLRTADSVILETLCSTGSWGELVDTLTGRRWKFETPAGVFVVESKLSNPWWRKPDWAFVEEGLPVPKNDAERLDNRMMGDYAIGFGDGYFIHGTIYERLLGRAVTHGCVRVGAEDLKKLYERTPIGTLVYVI